MPRNDPPVPDRNLERAVTLWCRLLRNPTKDNGDTSKTGAISQSLAAMNQINAASDIPDMDERIDRFGKALLVELKALRDHDMLPNWLECDYHPDKLLSAVANRCGIPLSQFSWKTDITIAYDTHVMSKVGYGAPEICHYPLADGRWLMCKLRGDDIRHVIAAVEAGTLTTLTIE